MAQDKPKDKTKATTDSTSYYANKAYIASLKIWISKRYARNEKARKRRKSSYFR